MEDPPPRRAHKTSPPSLESKYMVATSDRSIDDASAAVLAFGGKDSPASGREIKSREQRSFECD